MKRIQTIIVSLAGLLLVAIPGTVFAISYNLPEPLVGQAEIIAPSGEINWFGISGNEAIYNYDPNFLLGFAQSDILSCNGITDLRDLPFCFIADRPSSVDVMNSRTSLNGAFGLEVAALYWSLNSIQGDAYSSGNYLNNFAFYGNNLNKSSGSHYGSKDTWGVQNYAFNSQAQSYFDPSASSYYNSRIAQLGSEAINNTAGLASNNWYLQAKDAAGFIISNNDVGSSPEGKVWESTAALSIADNSTKTYSGKGTMIVNGNLTVGSGVKIIPDNSNADMLGIIVLGNVTIGANSDIEAPIFATGSITILGNNVGLRGSYVATDFVASGRIGVRFYYDFRLDSGWPPGFRYFNMPTAKNTAQ